MTGKSRIKRVAVIHELFEAMGGGEKLALELASALRSLGYSVTIYTSRLDLETAKRILGTNLEGVQVVEVGEPYSSRILRLLTRERGIRLRRLLILERILKEYFDELRRFDAVIETQSNIPTSVDVSYIHYPAVLDTYTRHALVRALYNALTRRAIRKLYGEPRLILTNSTWTARIIRRVYGIAAEVLHPPIDYEYFSKVADSIDRENNLILTVSRFSEEKRLDEIVRLASHMRNYRFILVGSAQTSQAKRYYEYLKRLAENLGAHNVELAANIPRNNLLELMSRARFYLHPPFAEHFGIAVAEAAAAGLIPIVYRDGGAWTDIAAEISPTLGYRNIVEVPNILENVGSDEELIQTLSERATRIASRFSKANFKKRLSSYIALLA